MTALSEALKARRATLGISQEKAAYEVGTNSNSYARWESGEDAPRKFSWAAPIADWLENGVTREDVALMILVDLDTLRAAGSGPGFHSRPPLTVRYLSRMSSLLSPRSALVLAPSAAAA